jgi:uncharacterized protein (DUF362 family)
MSKRGGKSGLSRREFLRMGVTAPASVALGGSVLGELAALGAESGGKTDVWVLHGKDKKKLMDKCLEVIGKNGGFGDKAEKLALKVNAAWNRTPQQGANTNPELVAAFLAGCKKAGIGEVVIAENPCNPAEQTFPRSGILAVAKKHGVKMINLRSDAKNFRKVKIPGGKKLKAAEVGKQFLDADVVVNMPVAKHHGSAKVTMAMKNWMGSVKDRRFWHRNDLHQCIADFSTFMKPRWTIIDATRIMLDRGPKGPTKNMKTPDLLVVSRDQVAADAWTALLFHKDPYKIRYLAIARDMKIGTTDLKDMAVHKIEVG